MFSIGMFKPILSKNTLIAPCAALGLAVTTNISFGPYLPWRLKAVPAKGPSKSLFFSKDF